MKVRKKPVVVEAMQVEVDQAQLLAWLTRNRADCITGYTDRHVVLRTLEGNMRADLGDWIIKGVKGELYPCKPDIFDETYEKVEDG